MSNPFDDVLGDAYRNRPELQGASREEEKSFKWEHKVVGLVLQHFGLAGHGASLSATAKARVGRYRLTFEIFKEAFPSFPMWLSPRKIPFANKVTIQHLAKDFRKTKLFKAFLREEAAAPEPFQSGRFGVVFEWLNTWPVAIIHNDFRALRGRGDAWFHNWPDCDPPQHFAVQSFSSFLVSLPWVPGE